MLNNSQAANFVFSPQCPQVARRFGYVQFDKQSLFTWQHYLAQGAQRKTAVILCNPMGYEYTHSHRSYQHWADLFAQAGCLVVRFDYASTGDSSGDELPENLVPIWLSNIVELGKRIQQTHPDYELCLVGLRMGGTLAHMAASQLAVQHLIVWEPIAQGRRYVRELSALANFGAEPADADADYTEFAGFLMSDATRDAIKTITLVDYPLPSHTRVLYLTKDETGTSIDYVQGLQSQGIHVEVQFAAGYDEMLFVPQDTVIPYLALENSVNWLLLKANALDSVLQGEKNNFAQHAFITLASGIQEQALWYDDHENRAQQKKLFGILSLPKGTGAKVTDGEKSLVILLNSGSVHHVGPNRVYTLMARTIAEAGTPCLRLDLAGLGDSYKPDLTRENHPYQNTAQANIETAIKYCQLEGLAKTFIVAGLCSGAHGAFHSALGAASANISEILVINPLAFYWEDGMTLVTPEGIQTAQDSKYYANSMRDPKKWLKLIRGKASLGYILGFIRKQLAAKFTAWMKYADEVILNNHTALSADILRIIRAKIAISFLVASNDPGIDLVNDQAKRTFSNEVSKGAIQVKIFSGANHTFSRYKHRQEFLAFIKEKFTGEHN